MDTYNAIDNLIIEEGKLLDMMKLINDKISKENECLKKLAKTFDVIEHTLAEAECNVNKLKQRLSKTNTMLNISLARNIFFIGIIIYIY